MEDLKPTRSDISPCRRRTWPCSTRTRAPARSSAARDAELTKAIYRRVPILIDESRQKAAIRGASILTMFHQTNDAELFHSPVQLNEMGCQPGRQPLDRRQRTFLPLYEAKMIQAYDHRAASVNIEAGNWVRQGQTEDTTLVEHQNPEFVVQPRWWVEDEEVIALAAPTSSAAYLGLQGRDQSDQPRTMIAALIPWSAMVNSAPVMFTGERFPPGCSCACSPT